MLNSTMVTNKTLWNQQNGLHQPQTQELQPCLLLETHYCISKQVERNQVLKISLLAMNELTLFQNSSVSFYYNRLPILTNDSIKTMGHFRVQLLLNGKIWSTRYNIPKKEI